MLHQQGGATRERRGRVMRMVAGFSFALGAIGWLAVNEQGRRTRVALRAAVQRAAPPVRRRLGRVWEWGMREWRDPWRSARRPIAAAARGEVLEVGIGTWPNVRHYGAVERLVGVEDQRSSAFVARQRVRRYRPSAQVLRARSDALPFPDASFDTVVASLALCTVHDQDATLREIARVLRPNGTLRFLEHVRSPNAAVGWLQHLLTPIWRLMADGCHMDRDTMEAIRSAGFTIIEMQPSNSGWWLTRPTYCGVACPPSTPAATAAHQTSEAV